MCTIYCAYANNKFRLKLHATDIFDRVDAQMQDGVSSTWRNTSVAQREATKQRRRELQLRQQASRRQRHRQLPFNPSNPFDTSTAHAQHIPDDAISVSSSYVDGAPRSSIYSAPTSAPASRVIIVDDNDDEEDDCIIVDTESTISQPRVHHSVSSAGSNRDTSETTRSVYAAHTPTTSQIPTRRQSRPRAREKRIQSLEQRIAALQQRKEEHEFRQREQELERQLEELEAWERAATS